MNICIYINKNLGKLPPKDPEASSIPQSSIPNTPSSQARLHELDSKTPHAHKLGYTSSIPQRPTLKSFIPMAPRSQARFHKLCNSCISLQGQSAAEA